MSFENFSKYRGENVWSEFFYKKVYRDEDGALFPGGVGMYAVYYNNMLIGYGNNRTEAEGLFIKYKKEKDKLK